MLERTKKRHTKNENGIISLGRFTGPKSKRDEAIKVLTEMGFTYDDNEETVNVDDWKPYREFEKNMPGSYLQGIRYREDLTQKQLSEMTGIPIRHISEMENNKRPIGKKNAVKLGKALHADYRMFL